MQSLPFKIVVRANGRAAAGIATVVLATACFAGAVTAADLEILIVGLRSNAGTLRVAVCPERSFLSATCPYVGTSPAPEGAVRVRGVPPGVYAIQAFHDENGNGELDRSRFGRPLEGMGFSRDAPMRRGPPRFSDAAFRLDDGNARATLTMRYFE